MAEATQVDKQPVQADEKPPVEKKKTLEDVLAELAAADKKRAEAAAAVDSIPFDGLSSKVIEEMTKHFLGKAYVFVETEVGIGPAILEILSVCCIPNEEWADALVAWAQQEHLHVAQLLLVRPRTLYKQVNKTAKVHVPLGYILGFAVGVKVYGFQREIKHIPIEQLRKVYKGLTTPETRAACIEAMFKQIIPEPI